VHVIQSISVSIPQFHFGGIIRTTPFGFSNGGASSKIPHNWKLPFEGASIRGQHIQFWDKSLALREAFRDNTGQCMHPE
jgi:hypothetical protein